MTGFSPFTALYSDTSCCIELALDMSSCRFISVADLFVPVDNGIESRVCVNIHVPY